MVDSGTLDSWKRELQQLYDSLTTDPSVEQFQAWFEEATMLEAEITPETETNEVRECVAGIKKDRQRYRQLQRFLKQLPRVAKFSKKEIEKNSGKAAGLRKIAGEIIEMEIYLPRKIDKLRFLLKNRLQ